VKNLKSVDEMTGYLKLSARNAAQLLGYGVVGLICLLLSTAARAEGAAGSVTHLSGVLFATHPDGTKKMLSIKSEIVKGDTLKTEVNTYARIKFSDGGEVVLRPETIFKIDSYSYGASQSQPDHFMVSLLKGGLRSVTGIIGKSNPENFKMKTETATVGIRGTHFGALLCNNDCAGIPTVSGHPPGNGLHTDTAQGATVVSNAAGSIEVPAGAFSYTPGPTSPPALVPPSQGIQVTMPTSISSNKASGSGLGSSDSNTCAVK
jgi:hypothetical protein